MIPGHFALKQIMHNKAEFVITTFRHRNDLEVANLLSYG